jgi:hypothetical protein
LPVWGWETEGERTLYAVPGGGGHSKQSDLEEMNPNSKAKLGDCSSVSREQSRSINISRDKDDGRDALAARMR